MSNDYNSSASVDVTAVRFGMCSLVLANLFIMTLVGASALIARQSSFEQRIQLILFWSVTLLTAFGLLSLFAFQRRHCEKLAGRHMFHFEHASPSVPRLSKLVNRIVTFAYLFAMTWAVLHQTYRVAIDGLHFPGYVQVLIGVLTGLLLACIAPLTWGRVVWISENGLLRGFSYVPWHCFDEFHFHRGDIEVAVLTGRSQRAAIRIPAAEREAAVAILTQKLGGKPAKHTSISTTN